MGSQERLPYKVSPIHGWARKNFLPIGHAMCPVEVHIIGDGWYRAEQLVKDGYGLGVVGNHFSLRDGPQLVADVICGNDFLRTRPILIPIASHQRGIMLRMMAIPFNIQLLPIVTKETIDRGLDNGFPIRTGEKEYVIQAISVLQKSGVVLLLPQATRCPYLDDKPERKPIGLLFARARKFNLDKFALLYASVELKGQEDYSDETITRYNLGETYVVKTGPCYTQEEVLALAGNSKKVDLFSLDVLKTLVPRAYLKSGRELSSQ